MPLVLRSGFSLLALVVLTLLAPVAVAAAAFNYPEVLQKSLYFYEAQRSGPLPSGHRVAWRGPSALHDGESEGVDLVGGFYDAGDHVKFGFPLAYTTTLLAWSLGHDFSSYERFGQLPYAVANLKAMTDWWLKAHTAPNELWAQVGSGYGDHGFWGAPEVMTMPRPAAKIDASCPGTDLAAETAAALAAASLALSPLDASYAAKLVVHARQLYTFADTYRGKYSDCIKEGREFYASWSGYQDELAWGAAWLYKATGEAAYLAKAEAEFAPFLGTAPRRNTLSWDDKSYGTYVLLAELTGKQVYLDAAETWLDYWAGVGPGEHGPKTPGGLAFISGWGPLRYSASTAMMALYYATYLNQAGKHPDKASSYERFAKQQIDYMLGANPARQSFVVGFGEHAPLSPHHRGAHGSWSNDLQLPRLNRHVLYGALVGGPNEQDAYLDDRGNYTQNEVALDYNAGFTGALAALSGTYGGHPDPAFPPREVPDSEFMVQSRINATGADFVEVYTRLHDHAAYPARFSTDLLFRYFISLAGLPLPERDPSLIKVTTAYDQSSGGVSAVKTWDSARGLYYIEVAFLGQRIGPVGAWESTREVQLRFTVPPSWQGRWDANVRGAAEQGRDDRVWQVNDHVPVYEGGQLVFGAAPPAAPVGT